MSRTARYSFMGTRGGSGHAAVPCISARIVSVPCWARNTLLGAQRRPRSARRRRRAVVHPDHFTRAARSAATIAARIHSTRPTPSRSAASSSRPSNRGVSLIVTGSVAFSVVVFGMPPRMAQVEFSRKPFGTLPVGTVPGASVPERARRSRARLQGALVHERERPPVPPRPAVSGFLRRVALEVGLAHERRAPAHGDPPDMPVLRFCPHMGTCRPPRTSPSVPVPIWGLSGRRVQGPVARPKMGNLITTRRSDRSAPEAPSTRRTIRRL